MNFLEESKGSPIRTYLGYVTKHNEIEWNIWMNDIYLYTLTKISRNIKWKKLMANVYFEYNIFYVFKNIIYFSTL